MFVCQSHVGVVISWHNRLITNYSIESPRNDKVDRFNGFSLCKIIMRKNMEKRINSNSKWRNYLTGPTRDTFSMCKICILYTIILRIRFISRIAVSIIPAKNKRKKHCCWCRPMLPLRKRPSWPWKLKTFKNRSPGIVDDKYLLKEWSFPKDYLLNGLWTPKNDAMICLEKKGNCWSTQKINTPLFFCISRLHVKVFASFGTLRVTARTSFPQHLVSRNSREIASACSSLDDLQWLQTADGSKIWLTTCDAYPL